MRRTVPAFLLLVAAFAVAAPLGWWTVPLVAGLWGALRPGFPRPILAAALAALLGWSVWLGIDLGIAPDALTRIGARAADILQLPSTLFLLLTLLFPALLAWSAAAVACRLANLLVPRGQG
ncbi:MAG TPA: hypothetical protein VGQ69_13990 [Gemmatimonadales bacterium]|jgi:hypothetical protein|nr:hypothetical protein [Gemmatimonadales bacterium]